MRVKQERARGVSYMGNRKAEARAIRFIRAMPPQRLWARVSSPRKGWDLKPAPTLERKKRVWTIT
jgi:hypothetical protein